jgi:putative membrane protein
VWLFVGLLGAAYVVTTRRYPDVETARRRPFFFAGLVVLWIASDWPLGPLGAGYLVSIHTLKYILYSFVIPPFLLHGLPRNVLSALLARPAVHHIVKVVARPLVAFAIFNVVMLGTHLPTVVDSFKTMQLGTFTIDMAWLIAGLVFWWQVLAPLPELDPLSYPGRIVFLIVNVFIPTVPAAFLTFADYPIYALYELAPRIGRLSPRADQQMAGMLMKIGGGFIIFGTASVLFFRWYADEESGSRKDEKAGSITA